MLAVAGVAGIFAAGATVGTRSAGTAVSALASSVVFGVGAPEHAMGQIVRAGLFVYSNFDINFLPTLVVITPATARESNTVEETSTQTNEHTNIFLR